MTAPWLWFALAVLLAALEVVLPSWVFLGFAIGAAATGLILAAGGPLAAAASASLPLLGLVFALVSLAAWAGLRRALGVRRGQVRLVRRDINETPRRRGPEA